MKSGGQGVRSFPCQNATFRRLNFPCPTLSPTPRKALDTIGSADELADGRDVAAKVIHDHLLTRRSAHGVRDLRIANRQDIADGLPTATSAAGATCRRPAVEQVPRIIPGKHLFPALQDSRLLIRP